MVHRIPVFERILSQAPADTRIVAVHTRGYGGSSGRPTESGLVQDAHAILDFTRQTFPDRPIFVYGHSLGGALAVRLAAEDCGKPPLAGLLLENTFTSMEALVRALFPRWLPYGILARYVLLDRWDTLRTLRELKRPLPPTLLLVGARDELIPPEMSNTLADALRRCNATDGDSVRVYRFPHGLHENTFLQANYGAVIGSFLQERVAKFVPTPGCGRL
jgi:pimeloyl-ACP methyl ester carboxylesterase